MVAVLRQSGCKDNTGSSAASDDKIITVLQLARIFKDSPCPEIPAVEVRKILWTRPTPGLGGKERRREKQTPGTHHKLKLKQERVGGFTENAAELYIMKRKLRESACIAVTVRNKVPFG